MQEEVITQLGEVNEKLTPILADIFETIDAKTATIYFASLTRTLLDELNDDDFQKLIMQYLTDGD